MNPLGSWTPDSFLQHDWSEWSLIQPADDDPFIQTQWLRLKVPEVRHADALQQDAAQRCGLQPPECL